MSRISFCIAMVLLAPTAFAEKWVQQYFYDQNGKQFRITDLAFASATRGVAVGAITNDEGRAREFLALVTSDGGEHWTKVPLKEFPRSLFFLNESPPGGASKNESLGWMVTENGVWLTEESGRSWRRVGDQIKPNKKLPGAPAGGLLDRVWFLDARHGFAIGAQKAVFESKDGGRTWVAVLEAAKPFSEQALSLAYSAYTAMAFAAGPSSEFVRGIITGGYVPPPRTGNWGVPGWMEPKTMMNRAPERTLAFELDTYDGGASWRPSTAAAYGAVTQIHLAGHWGLSVWNFDDASEWASEVQRIPIGATNDKPGKGETVFRRKDRTVTDSQLFPDGSAFLAGVEPNGTMRSVPIPGKVKILRAANVAELRASDEKKIFRDDWMEMQVDYRAVANLVFLSGPDAKHMWAATDTGMILKLVK